MSEQTKTVTWEMLLANVAPSIPEQEPRSVQPVPRAGRLYIPPPAGVTMPRDLDAERLTASSAALPAGLSMEFSFAVKGRPPAMYVTKTTAGVSSHWATFAIHIDPVYGEWEGRALPRHARKWLGRTPWATVLMIAHEVPAWCMGTYPDTRRLPVAHLVSDIASIARPAIDPILYGVMVSGKRWGFVPLASWRL
jgi:hypothetical protein